MSIIKHVTLQKIVAHDFRYDPRNIMCLLLPRVTAIIVVGGLGVRTNKMAFVKSRPHYMWLLFVGLGQTKNFPIKTKNL